MSFNASTLREEYTELCVCVNDLAENLKTLRKRKIELEEQVQAHMVANHMTEWDIGGFVFKLNRLVVEPSSTAKAEKAQAAKIRAKQDAGTDIIKKELYRKNKSKDKSLTRNRASTPHRQTP